jgi:hypothetical protein
MQDKMKCQRMKLELMNLRLAEIEAERDNIKKEVQALKSSLTQVTLKGRLHRVTVAAASVLAVSTLLSASVSHNALSYANNNNKSDDAVINALVTGQIVRGENQPASAKKTPPRKSKKKIRITRVKAASQQQWGPALIMPEPETKRRHYLFDTLVKAQQKNLLTLGFDIGEADGYKGAGTRQAIAEFRALYLPDSAKQLQDADIAIILETYANLARSDAARFGIDHGVVAAIRLSSIRTGVDFAYLMKLAATESNFKPASESATSSATGIYQFTHDTWLNTLKTHGGEYGPVADYAENIEYKVLRSGYQRPIVDDESIYQHLLALRKNPRISAIMAAETVREYQQNLAHSLDREPTETDLYLTHFLGPDNANTFLQSLQQSPGTFAVELFPRAASSNHDIFHPKTCEPRTVDEVYSHFGEKFSTRRYDDFTTNVSAVLAKN